MNLLPPSDRSQLRKRQRGYAAIAMVAVIGMVALFGMVVTYRETSTAHEAEKRSQVRIDYTQKEDAFLRALVATVPNKAIDAMRNDSRSRASSLTWQQVFTEAIELANAEHSVSAAMINEFDLTTAVVANPGDQALTNPASIVTGVVGGSGYVNPGVTQSSALLLDSRYQDRLPDPLEAPGGVAIDDEVYPVITRQKVFSSSWNTEADLSVSDYPVYNRITYPNVQFGYKAPGERFVAKRNWWAFSVAFGKGNTNASMGPAITKNYVLSIYEIPAQLPISADTFMKVGRHQSGLNWSNVAIGGSISGSVLETEGSFQLPSGRFSSRRSMTLGSGTTASGQALRNDFDALGVREQMVAASNQDYSYAASLSANSGRVAFVPINRHVDFFNLPLINATNTISPTNWDDYSTGAVRCQMRVTITKVRAANDQIPSRIDFRCKGPSGDIVRTLERGVNWPTPTEAGGDTVPFQTEQTESGRKGIVVYLERLPAYMASIGAQGMDVNQSLLIHQDQTRDPNIQVPVFPTVETESVSVLRECADLTPWTRGLSVVTNMRLYFGDDFNVVETAPPAGSGIAAGTPFYPPVSVFAPEKRYGTTLKTRPVEHYGQLGTLAQGEILAYHPLDLKAGTYETVNESAISADLKAIESPAELPPIHLMNWLIMVEEMN